MSQLSQKDHLLEQIQIAHLRFKTLVYSVRTRSFLQHGVEGDWAIKDIVAHVTWREGNMLRRLRNEPPLIPSLPDEDEDAYLQRRNRQIFMEHGRRPVEDVMSDFRASFTHMLAVLEALPESAFEDVKRVSIIKEDTCDHYAEHEQSILTWISTRRDSPCSTFRHVVDILSQSRARTLATLSSLDEETLQRRGVIGEWSIKNVVAHLAAREGAILQTLPDRLRTKTTPPLILSMTTNPDAWNAREVARRERFSPRDQLQELDQHRHNLIDLLHKLGEKTLIQPQPWPECAPTDTLVDYLMNNLVDHERAHRETLERTLAQLGIASPF